jgi:tetratricopeptide (TPR) repeat protein/transglutaminase-like putative cysteine protease
MLSHFRLRARLALPPLLLLVIVVPVRGTDWPVALGPSREPVPYRYDPACWKQVPKAFLEDASACILYSATTHLLEPDGTIETITHEITRLNGRKGIDKLGEYRNITYSPAYQKLTLNVARVLKANGQVVAIEPRHVQLRDLSTDYQVYDSDKQLVISFPNLEVGDVYEVKWTVRGKNPEHMGHLFTRYTFGDDQFPVAHDELRVRLPSARPLKFAVINGKVEPMVRDEGKNRFYQWAVTNCPALPQDENLPSKEELRRQLACSTFASWAEVGQWKQKLRADCWKCSDAIRQIVLDVTKGLKTPEEKARALAYWVRRRIRYVSVGPIRHDYTPHLPDAVLENLFGDCKDQAQLLALMLRAAGLEVYLVTLGALDDGQILPEVPSPWGTHAIVLVHINGQDHWIDTTATLSPWNFLPRDDRNRVAYVTDDRGGIRVLRTPALTPADNRVETTTHVAVQVDGSTKCRRTVTYQGSASVSQRDAWIEVPPGERRRLVTAELQDANSRTRLRSLTVDDANLPNPDRPVTARLEYDIPGHFSGTTEREGSLTDSRVWGRLLAYSVDPDRKTPLDLGSPFESVHHYLVELPAMYRFDGLPQTQLVLSKWGSFHLAVWPDVANPHRLELKYRTVLDRTRVEPADLAAFRRFQDDVNKSWRVWLTLKPTEDLADAPLLEKMLDSTPADSASALTLARLYQHHGRTADARRVLRQALLSHPANAALWELRVKTAATPAEEEATYEEMVRRFPDEARYAVALGAARVKRGDHAGARAVLEPLGTSGTPSVRGPAHYQLARSAFLQGQPAAALQHLEAAGRAAPDTLTTTMACQFKAQVYEQLGQLKEAAEAYRQALKVDPEARAALAALIRLDLTADRRADALLHLRRYTLLVEEEGEGLAAAAEFHLQLGRPDEAFELASRVNGKAEGRAERVLGQVCLQRGDYRQAVLHLENAAPDRQATVGLIRSYLALGKLREAEKAVRGFDALVVADELRQLRALVQKLVDRRQALLAAARLPLHKGEAWPRAADAFVCAEQGYGEGRSTAEVEKLLAHAFEGEAELGPALALRALLALEKGRLTRALADADRATTLSPGEARGYYVRGRVRLERGDREGLADLTRAAELSGRKDAAILHWLATGLFQAGDAVEALAVQREAVRLRPQDAELAEQLREFERAQTRSSQENRGAGARPLPARSP